MLTPIQIVLLLFTLFALSRVYLRAREKVISPRISLFWFFIWFVAAVGIINPATTVKIAEFFGVGRGVDIIVYLSLILLFYLVFRMYVTIEDLRHEITNFIRQVALQNAQKTRRSNPKGK